jgi:protein O-mannosyl-transferase
MTGARTDGGTPSRLRMREGVALLLLVLAVLLVYAGSLNGPFVFDDVPAILENPTLRHPTDLASVLIPSGAEAGTVGGRPVLNLSLALNFAAGGTRPWGYHAVNVVFHAAAELLLFGIVLRTLRTGRRPGGWAAASSGLGKEIPWSESYDLPVAFLAALLWAVHPIQTEAVTYVVQRAESLMGVFYLLTLYGFIGYAAAARPHLGAPPSACGPKGWAALSISACVLGMATKEVMVSAPLVVFLYDRTFVSGSFRKSWSSHGRFLCALGATWLLLAALVASTHGRGGSAGFGAPAEILPYALSQCSAIVHYLAQSFWPNRLLFDSGTALVRNPAEVLPQILILAALLAATGYALCRHPVVGFLAFSFFVLLAPSSSLLPIVTEPVAEHRMYLPLAVVSVLFVAGVASLFDRLAPHSNGVFLWLLGATAAAGLGTATFVRNRDYGSAVDLWTDTVRKSPANPRAHNNLAEALIAAGRAVDAVREFEAAVRADPDYAPAQYNLGVTMLDNGRAAESIPHLQRALSAPRHGAELHLYLAEALERVGRHDESIVQYLEALRLAPNSSEASFGLGNNLAAIGHFAEAVEAFRTAVALAPGRIPIRNNLANALMLVGRRTEAIAEYREALRRDPQNASILENLRLALEESGNQNGSKP